MIPIEVSAFKNFINNQKINFYTYLILITKIPLDLIEFLIRNISGPVGFILRRYYYKTRLKKMGSNVFIDVGVHFIGHKNISLDDFVYVDKYCLITVLSSLEIGKRVHIGSFNIIHAGLNGDIKIGDYVGCSANTTIYSSIEKNLPNKRLSGPMIPYSEKATSGKPINLEKDSFISPNCLILPGVNIGYGAIISPNTVVKKNIKELSIVDNSCNEIKKREFNL